MDGKTKKAILMAVVAYFLTRDYRMVVVMAGASYLADMFL